MSTGPLGQPSPWNWHDRTQGEVPHPRVSVTTEVQQEGPKEEDPSGRIPGQYDTEPQRGTTSSANAKPPDPSSKRKYQPRTCRICLEVTNPTYQAPSVSIPGILEATPTVSYISSDPAAGHLIRPCKCKGSSMYVHEGCLQSWRYADPALGKRNYWHCPTCGFQYRLERMKWANWLSSKGQLLPLRPYIWRTSR